jgi:hypothetical protein
MERLDQQMPTPTNVARMYRRVLASWTMDALALRRAGLDLPSHRAGRPSMEEPPARSPVSFRLAVGAGA